MTSIGAFNDPHDAKAEIRAAVRFLKRIGPTGIVLGFLQLWRR
jgi:hypothetical protein